MLKKAIKVPSVPFSVNVAILILRVGVGLLMAIIGFDKLGKLLSGDLSFADPLGLGEGLSLYLTVFAEFVCSLLLVVGLFTRPALIFLMFTMVVAVFIVHAGHGLEKQEHGLLYLIPFITIFITGPGRISLDQYFFSKFLNR